MELGQAYLKKGPAAWGSPFPDGLVPQEQQLLPEVQRVAEMSEIDKNLIRDATTKIIDMIQQEAKCGPYSRTRDETVGQKTPQSGED